MTKLFHQIPIVLITIIFSTLYSFSQISDSLYNHLLPEAKPLNRNNITNIEFADILHATDYNDIQKFRKEYELIKNLCISKINSKKTNISDRIHLYSGIACYYKKDYTRDRNDKSLEYYKNVLTLANNDQKYYKDLLEAYYSLIYIYIDNYNSDSALYLLDGLNKVIKSDDSTSLSKLYNINSFVYEKVKNYELSTEYRKKTLALLKSYEISKDEYMSTLSRIVSNYVNLYKNSLNTSFRDSAFHYVNIFENKSNIHNKKWLSFSYYLKSKLVLVDSNFSLSLNYNYAFDSLEKIYGGNGIYANMNIFNDLTKYSNLAYLGYDFAIPILENLIHNPFMLDQKANTCKLLYEYHANKKSWEKAYLYLKLFQATTDSMKVEDNRNNLFEFNQKIKIAEKENEIKQLENKNLRKSRLIIIIISISVLLAIGMITFINLLSLKEKRNKIEDALHIQNLLDKISQSELKSKEEKKRIIRQNELALLHHNKEITKQIHDGISNGIAALRFYIEDLKINTPNPQIQKLLSSLEEETNSLYIQTRDLMNNLRGNGIYNQIDIISFLEDLQIKFSNSSKLSLEIDADSNCMEKQLNNNQKNHLYFIIKESVINVIKHANASLIKIIIKCNNNVLILEVSDNGVGYIESKSKKGLGLENIKSRIESLNGEFTISRVNTGTIIKVLFPII